MILAEIDLTVTKILTPGFDSIIGRLRPRNRMLVHAGPRAFMAVATAVRAKTAVAGAKRRIV